MKTLQKVDDRVTTPREAQEMFMLRLANEGSLDEFMAQAFASIVHSDYDPCSMISMELASRLFDRVKVLVNDETLIWPGLIPGGYGPNHPENNYFICFETGSDAPTGAEWLISAYDAKYKKVGARSLTPDADDVWFEVLVHAVEVMEERSASYILVTTPCPEQDRLLFHSVLIDGWNRGRIKDDTLIEMAKHFDPTFVKQFQ